MFTHFPIKRSILTAVGVAAAALPAGAGARPLIDSLGDAQTSAPAPVVTVVREPAVNASPGFQWGDAGVGAAGAIVLLGAGTGAAATIRRRRTHRLATS